MILGTGVHTGLQPASWKHSPAQDSGNDIYLENSLNADSQPQLKRDLDTGFGSSEYFEPALITQRPSGSELVPDEPQPLSQLQQSTNASTSTRWDPSPRALRSKVSSSSISSTSSSSSNTTTQTFLSTVSFSTVTGGHLRSTTQENILSFSASSDSRTRSYSEPCDEDEGDGQVNLDSVDVAIFTPWDISNINPFGSLDGDEGLQHGRGQSPSMQHFGKQPSLTNTRRHTKTLSQLSSGAATVRLLHTSDDLGISSCLSSPPKSSSSVVAQPSHSKREGYKPSENDGATEEMLFASPKYRKSLALSEHSDLAPDPSSPSGRGSSASNADVAPQYRNLLRDATHIIQYQEVGLQRMDVIESEHGDLGEASSQRSGHAAREGDDARGPAGTRNAQKGTQPSEGGSLIEGTPASIRKGTLTKSRSRRLSAPGHPGSSHTSFSSLSKSSGSSMLQGSAASPQDVAGTTSSVIGARAPHTFSENDGVSHAEPDIMEGHVYLPGVHPNINVQGTDRTAPNHSPQPLQHHATMQTHLTAGAPETLSPTPPAASSSASQHQPHLHHDYRPGVVFEYYEGEWDWLPNFDEMRPDHAGIVGNFMIDDTTEQDLFRPQYTHQIRRHYKESGNFAVRFTTYIDIMQDGVYSFWLSSNDGSVLYVANTLVVENDGMHYAAEAEGRILLQAGRHPVIVEFFHRNGKMLEGFRSTGPSLIVSYRAPGPIWSFGFKAGPKRIIKSTNLFYDHGDIRLRNLLREFGVEDFSLIDRSDAMSGSGIRPSDCGAGTPSHWRQGTGGNQQNVRPTRHRIMSGDMGAMQPSNRELHVQMENAKTTIKDLEQIIREQAESHKKKMTELYSILQDTQAQVDRMVTGLKKATLFESPRMAIPVSHVYGSSNPTWRNTVVSVYVDAEEDYPLLEPEHDRRGEPGLNDNDGADGDDILAKHVADVERLKQLYFFSMALSVKMNSEMMGKKTPEYTSTSVQKLYEDCTVHSKIPVEGWPGYVSRCFARRPTA